jgi:hypothetical protein
MFGKDFTDPHTLLIAIGITIVSVVEGGIQMEDTSGRFWQSLFMVFQQMAQ